MIALGRILGGVAWLCTLLCILLTFIGMLAGNSVDAPILRVSTASMNLKVQRHIADRHIQYSATEFGDALNGYIKRGFTNSTVIQDNHVEGGTRYPSLTCNIDSPPQFGSPLHFGPRTISRTATIPKSATRAPRSHHSASVLKSSLEKPLLSKSASAVQTPNTAVSL